MRDRFEEVRGALRGALRTPPPDGALVAALACVGPSGERAWIEGTDGPGGAPVHDVSLRMRLASITKMAVARAALAAGLDPEAPASDLLDWPGAAPTLGALMSHTSGLTDEAGYAVEDPEALIAGAATGTPGHFRYCNLAYVLLGCAIERATGEPLGETVRRLVLAPAGIGGGLNWWGVRSRRALPLWQWQGDRHVLEVDGPGTDWGAALIWRGGAGADTAAWRPGRAAWFSPQGGLRASVPGAARLVRHCLSGEIGSAMMAPRWTFDGANGSDGGGLFPAYGLGVTLHDRVLPGRRAGHAGHALGVSCGAWLDRDTGDGWAYALTGQPDRTGADGDETFYEGAELHAMQALAGRRREVKAPSA